MGTCYVPVRVAGRAGPTRPSFLLGTCPRVGGGRGDRGPRAALLATSKRFHVPRVPTVLGVTLRADSRVHACGAENNMRGNAAKRGKQNRQLARYRSLQLLHGQSSHRGHNDVDIDFGLVVGLDVVRFCRHVGGYI